jgi:16S rRNA (cytosine967-C5)-methyltransferase
VVLRLGKWDLRVVVEVLVRGEEYKPFQVAKRMVLERYGLLGSAKDRVFTALVYGVWRVQGIADRVVEEVLGVKPSQLHPWLRALLRLYVYQRLWAHRDHPDMTEWVERYGERVLEERAGRGEVVLWRRFLERFPRARLALSRVEAGFMVSRTLYELLVGFIGRREAERLLGFVNTWVPPIALRVNRLRARVEEVVELVRRSSPGARVWVSSRYPYTVFVERGRLPLRGSRVVEEGLAVVQDEPSALASEILAPRPGELVVDLCAAPGGKTTHLAELMEGRGTVVAFDVFPDRMARLRELVERHGVAHVVEPVLADGRLAPRILGEEVADRVLVDPPCSTTGTLAKNPDVRWRITREELRRLTRLQEELLEAAARLVKPGGRILYTVCSLLREEGEDVVSRVLQRHPELRIVPLRGPYDESPALPGTMRSWPHRHQVTGFFYALLEKARS